MSGRLRIIKRMEKQPLLQRRERQDVVDPRVLTFQSIDLGLRECHQRESVGAVSAGLGSPALRRRGLDSHVRQCTPGAVRGSRLLHNARNARKRAGGLTLEHGTRGDQQTGLARPAHQLDRHDAVAAEREETVVDADPLHSQDLGKQAAQDLFLRGTRRPPHDRRSEVGSRQCLAVELAVWRERKRVQHDEGRRHHVAGRLRQRCARSAAASALSPAAATT